MSYIFIWIINWSTWQIIYFQSLSSKCSMHDSLFYRETQHRSFKSKATVYQIMSLFLLTVWCNISIVFAFILIFHQKLQYRYWIPAPGISINFDLLVQTKRTCNKSAEYRESSRYMLYKTRSSKQNNWSCVTIWTSKACCVYIYVNGKPMNYTSKWKRQHHVFTSSTVTSIWPSPW